MARAYTPLEIARKKYDKLQWGPKWREAFHQPETTGVWWIGAESQNGKTTFIMELVKELADLDKGKVMINALEEGTRLTMQENVKRHGLEAYNGRLLFGNETYSELDKRLCKQRSPWAVIVDSVQLFKMSPSQFETFWKRYNEKKLIIFTSHMDGGEPKGTISKMVKYYADLKLMVEGFKAISAGRFNAGGSYTIWEEGAARYWEGKK